MDINKSIYSNMDFDPLYLADEIREGFYISTMMKRYWACQLRVLAEIDKICVRHNIPWYADNGTLLGAIRHKGYIPWDDDLDICMLRDDWIRFFEVAKDELPDKYYVLSLQKEEEYEQMLGRITNGNKVSYGEVHLKEFYNCPYTVGVDIFPLDALADDEEEEEARRSKLLDIAAAMTYINSGLEKSDEAREVIRKIEKDNHVSLEYKRNLKRELLLLSEKLYSLYPTRDAKYVSLMPYWVSHHNHKYEKALYDNRVLVPFENTQIYVPARFEEVLKVEYGDYMRIVKGGGVHEYPVYKDQEAMLKEHIETNPYRYTFPDSSEVTAPRKGDIKEQIRTLTGTLDKTQKLLNVIIQSGNVETLRQALEGCQSLAIALGNLIENYMVGTDIIPKLEDYCEKIFICHSEPSVEALGMMTGLGDSIIGFIEDYLVNKKEDILFILCRHEWWDNALKMYYSYAADGSKNVYVMCAPYKLDEINSGTVEGESVRCDSAYLPSDVNVVTLEEYNYAERYPETIIVQNPYDQFNLSYNIQDYFCTNNLKNYTSKLIYLSPDGIEPPVDDKDKAIAALEVLIEEPANVYADEILVDSEGMGKLYVDTLSELSGLSKEFWENKVRVCEPLNKGDVVKNGPKVLLFEVNIAFLLKEGMKAVQKIDDALKVIDGSDSVACICRLSGEVDELKTIDKELYDSLAGVLSKYGLDINVAITTEIDYVQVDAFYGSTGYSAHMLRSLGKPVMIMNVNV